MAQSAHGNGSDYPIQWQDHDHHQLHQPDRVINSYSYYHDRPTFTAMSSSDYLDPDPSPHDKITSIPGSMIPYKTPEHPRLRTAQACEKCRIRKAKCSGEHPTCKRCYSRGLQCEYATEGRGSRVRGPAKKKWETPPVDSEGTEMHKRSPSVSHTTYTAPQFVIPNDPMRATGSFVCQPSSPPGSAFVSDSPADQYTHHYDYGKREYSQYQYQYGLRPAPTAPAPLSSAYGSHDNRPQQTSYLPEAYPYRQYPPHPLHPPHPRQQTPEYQYQQTWPVERQYSFVQMQDASEHELMYPPT